MSTAPLVNCPQCGKSSVYSKTNPHRPFCSERCKLIDLGAWAHESYRVPGTEVPDPNDEQPNADPGQ